MRFRDAVKGAKVIIRSNRYNVPDSYIVGTVVKDPPHFTSILIRYNSAIQGEVQNIFCMNELEDVTAESCIALAQWHKNQALEFFELAKRKGYVSKKDRA